MNASLETQIQEFEKQVPFVLTIDLCDENVKSSLSLRELFRSKTVNYAEIYPTFRAHKFDSTDWSVNILN